MILCDTCILFEIFRGNTLVLNECEKIGYENLAISDITVGEIYFGMRKGQEEVTRNLIKKFKRFRMTEDVSKLFVEIMADNSHPKIKLPDALIAAVSIANSLSLFTINIKDFKEINNIKLYKPSQKLKV